MKRIPYCSKLSWILIVFVLSAASQAELLSGRVYEGEYLTEPPTAEGLADVSVKLYASYSSDVLGDEVASYTTGSDGWYGLETEQNYEFFTIVCEGKSGYTFQDSSSIGGSASGEKIEYVVPLGGKTLTGNKFWYLSETPPPENNPPVANDDFYNVDADSVLTVSAPGVLGNDSDLDGDPLTASLFTVASNGAIILSDDGSFTYTPNAGFSGTDYFTYLAFDPYNDYDEATVTITVLAEEPPENNPPVADAGGPYSTQVGMPLLLDGSGSYDPDAGDSITKYEWYESNLPISGAHTTPTYVWVPPGAGQFTIKLEVTDSHGESDTDTAMVTVEEGGEPPEGEGAIRGVKFNDLNDNGQREPDEPGLPDWEITLSDNDGIVLATTMTNQNGEYQFENLEPGTYQVSEEDKQGWFQTFPPEKHYSGVTLSQGEVLMDMDFGNRRMDEGGNSIRGMKYNDLNGNGQKDPGEPGIPGWTIFLDSNDNGIYDEDDESTTTDANGNYAFTNLQAGVYRIHEVNQTGWLQRDPAVDGVPGYWLIDLQEGQQETDIDFGNYRTDEPPTGDDGSVVVIKEATPADDTPFLFCVYNPASFFDVFCENLKDPSHNTLTIADPNQLEKVTESVPGGWTLKDITITGDTDNGSTIDLANATVYVDCDEGENIVIIFKNEKTGEVEYDYGDAPDPTYPTLLVNNGARHVVDEDLFLGYTIDPEANGQPTPNADGDDNTGNNDEDGVTMSPLIAPGQAVPITVVASTGGVLNAWLDFNIDGSWTDAGEHIIAAQPVSSGANSFTINVPANARLGQTYARFRLSSVRDLSYDGQAPDGEVEDYTVEINAGGQVGGTIIIEKQTIPDGAPDMFGFTGILVGITGGYLGDGGQYVVGGLEPGQYSVQEQMTSGWTLTDIIFSDNNSTKNLQTRTATISLEAGETVKAVFTNRKATSTPAPVTFPHGDWPTYAQDEISVHPEPPTAGSLTRLCAEVVNNDPVNAHVVTLEFRVANFGIGLPWNAVDSTSVHVPPGSVASGCVVWTPPGPGHWCIEVVLHQEGAEPQRSQRNIDADEPLQPGESHSRVFEVGNPFDHRVDITLGLVPHLPNWGLELYPDILLDMAPGEIREVTLTVTPPQGEPLPPDGTVIVDVEAYAEGVLIGGFRKTFRPPVPLHRFPDPPYAEGEITVHPYPVKAGEPTEVCVELRNPTADPLDVMVQFSWANFGIGIPFTPINGLRPVHLPPHSTVKECIHWIPPVSGSVCIQVELHMEGYDPQCSQRNIDIDEPLQPGEPHSLTFEVGNPFDHRVDITLGLVPHLPNWGLELYPDILLDMAPGEIREVTLTVTPPPDEPLPAAGEVIVDVEAFVDGELIGGFRKVFSPPVTVHRPKDPVYAETEIGVDPYPIVPGQPVNLSVELYNPTDTDQVVQTRFSVAPFGIGLPFSDEHIMPNPIHIFVPAHGAARGHVTWNPPPGVTGKFCVQVTLELEGHEPLWSRRCIDVGEPLQPGEPHSLTFPVGNPLDHTVDITLGLVPHLPNWGLELYPDILLDMAPGETREVTLTVTPPPDEPLPAAGEVIVDVEAYAEGELIGGFRKLNVPPVSVHKPHEKSYAETEISVDPDPPQEGQETTVSAVLHNTGDVPVVVNVEFGWADFGMGIPFSNVGIVPPVQMVTLAPSALTSVDAAWTPTQSGHQCILIRLTDPEGQLDPQESQRNVDVTELPSCGETKVFTFTIYNDSPFSVTVDLGLITFDVPSDWEVTTDPTGSVLVGPHDEVEIKVIVKIPCPPSLQVADTLQRVGGGVPTIDVEGYINGVLKGGIQIQFGEIITAPELKPVAHWKFDEIQGTTALDSSGYHHGMVHNGTWTEGIIDGALNLNGLNGYVDCGDSDLLGPEHLTLAMWLHPAHMGGTRYIVSRGQKQNDNIDFAVTRWLNGEIEFTLSRGDNNPVSIVSQEQVPLDQWSHVTVTCSGDSASVYINGMLDASEIMMPRAPYNESQFVLGWLSGETRFFHGKIDEVILYDQAFSQEKIAELADLTQ